MEGDITLLKQRMDETEWHMRDSMAYATGEPQVLLTMTVFGFQPKARRRIWEAIRRRIPIGFNRNFKEARERREMKNVFWSVFWGVFLIGIGFFEIYVPPIKLGFTILGYVLIILGAFGLGFFCFEMLLERRRKI